MNTEHKRLLAIAEKAKDEAVIKASDRILVLVANKEGMWTINGNLGNNENAVHMMEGICSELRNSFHKAKSQ